MGFLLCFWCIAAPPVPAGQPTAVESAQLYEQAHFRAAWGLAWLLFAGPLPYLRWVLHEACLLLLWRLSAPPEL